MKRPLRFGLKTQSHPAMALFLGITEPTRPDRIRQGKKGRVFTALGCQAFVDDLILMIQHRPQPLPRDIPRTRSVNRVAHGHVISGNRLRDRPRSPAHPEKHRRRLLPRPDLGEGAVGGQHQPVAVADEAAPADAAAAVPYIVAVDDADLLDDDDALDAPEEPDAELSAQAVPTVLSPNTSTPR